MEQIQDTNKPIPLSQLKWRDYIAAKNYNTDINKMCSLCQTDQLKKFGRITISCKGLATTPKELLKDYKSSLTEDELDDIEQIYNPYHWAYKNIKPSMFQRRWYQEFSARCTATKNVSRMGRRVGKSYGFAVKALHRLFLNENTKILMLAPAESQVKEFDEILKNLVGAFREDFMRPEEFLINSRKKPYYEIDFSNGSQFRGLIAANDAKTVRGQGQGVSVIILDEVDYIPEEALTAVMGILLDNPGVELWVSSTPAGKAKLYSLENEKQYRTFHFPSFVIPHMSDILETELRTQYGHGVKWIHEVLAEYGDDEAGVFQNYFIEKCYEDRPLENKREDVLRNRSKYLVILGVDWNDDKVGTRLVTVAFDRERLKFFTANIETISKDGWTQVAAAERLIELNRKYVYDQIYLDEGFGVSTIQFIKKFALDKYGKTHRNDPDLRLANVVGINFSSNIEIKDIETNQIIKKDMKSYIVENATRYLERFGFMFDKEYDKSLIQQMEGYRILRRTPSGKAVYGAAQVDVGDHDLDGWMLALLGFNLEYKAATENISPKEFIVMMPREAKGEQADFSKMATEKVRNNISQYNNIFATSAKKRDNGEEKRSKFFEKYIQNSDFSIKNQVTRSGRRGTFKEGSEQSSNIRNLKRYEL